MKVLAINAFDGGSHRQFIRQAQEHSRFDWHVINGKPVHWKWRMRHAPLELAASTRKSLEVHGRPDVVLCTDMLDLPTWKGFAPAELHSVPTAVYFHENQFTYPVAPGAREDFHYAYTNLLTAVLADACLFNSAFHRDEFLDASSRFLNRVPDGANLHDLDSVAAKSCIVPPGFDPPETMPARTRGDRVRIGWVSRWEADKRPDRLVDLCERLTKRSIEFDLILLGARPRSDPPELIKLREKFGDAILHDGFAASRAKYWDMLSSMDVVVSTADHEFFGIGVCEAIHAGAMPVLPNRLSYLELVSPSCLYGSLSEATDMIVNWRACESVGLLEDFTATKCIAHLDNMMAHMKK